MSQNEPKSTRFSFRIEPSVLERLHQIADALHTPLGDLLVTGALVIWARATNQAEYLATKSSAITAAADDHPLPPRKD